MPVGQILAIKEPYYRKSRDGGLTVRVDNPANMVKLTPGDPMLSGTAWASAAGATARSTATSSQQGGRDSSKAGTAMPETGAQHRDRGRVHFLADELLEALACYAAALAIDPSDCLSLSNQAECYLRLGDWTKAQEKAEAALAVDGGHVKSLFRRGKALMGQGLYREAHGCFTAPLLKGTPEAKILAAACTTKHAQSTEGNYAWDDLLLKTAQVPESRLDAADYWCPALSRAYLSGKGMGVKAVRAIKEGDLLVVSKAVHVLFPSEVKEDLRYHMDATEKSATDPSDLQLQDELRAVLARQQAVKEQVLTLSRGRFDSTSTSAHPVPVCDLPEDLALKHVAATNKFGWVGWYEQYGAVDGKSTEVAKRSKKTSLKDGSSAAAGLWLSPSYFNHSCLPNCDRTMVGDLLVVHASRDIAAGEECTMAYTNTIEPKDGKQEDSPTKSWGFSCACELCQLRASGLPALPATSKAAEMDGLDWRQRAGKMATLKAAAMSLERDDSERLAPDFRALMKQVQADLPSQPPVVSVLKAAPLAWAFTYFARRAMHSDAIAALEARYAIVTQYDACAVHRQQHALSSAVHRAFVANHVDDVVACRAWIHKAKARFLTYFPGASRAFEELRPGIAELLNS